MPLIIVLWRNRQEELCEFSVSLDYISRSRKARDTEREPVTINKQASKKLHSSIQTTVGMDSLTKVIYEVSRYSRL